MFTFLATIFSLKWISEHITQIIIGIVIIIILIISTIHRRNKAIRQYAAEQKAREEAAAAKAREMAEQQKTTLERLAEQAAKVKPFPADLDGVQVEYAYRDVVIVPEGLRRDITRGEELMLSVSDEHITVKFHSIPIGHLRENRLAEMVRDWNKKGDPYKAYFLENTDDGPMIALFFYSDVIGKFLQKNPGAKLITLTGKQDDLAFYDVGDKCEIESDTEDPDKYIVTCDDATIGRFPAAGISYAEEHNCSPEDLFVIIAEVEYDIEKERDIISVYITD